MVVRVLVASQPAAHGDDADLRPMERELVAALAIRRPAAVSISSLSDALWGDEAPPSARKTIQWRPADGRRAQLGELRFVAIEA